MLGIKKLFIFSFLVFLFVGVFGINKYKEYKLEELKNFFIQIELQEDKSNKLLEYSINNLETNFSIILAIVTIVGGIIFYFLYLQIATQQRLEEKNKELNNSLTLVDKYVILSRTDINGIIEEVSSAFCEITGYKKEELIGQKHNIIRDPDTPKEYFELMWKTLGEGKIWNGIIRDRKKNGDKYWIKTYIEPIYDDFGVKVGYKNIAVDITDSKALEKINRNLKKKIKKAVNLNISQYQARQKEHLDNIKLSSIGSLAAGITHEINTPLTYIKGNFEMMKYDIIDLENNEILKETLLENHKRIYDGIIRISTIITAMREIASGSNDDIKVATNLYNSLFTSLTMLHNKAKLISRIYVNGKLFDIGMAEENSCKCEVYVHKQRIEQVWIVIMNNALDELVKIDDYEKRKISIDLEDGEEKVTIYFKDNAGGIDPHILNHIFDPFVTTKESGGIGIGLSISKKIIEGNNGTIEAYNEENQAVFKITFPKYLEDKDSL